VARIILLDAGPLGLLAKARGIPAADQCRAWLAALEAAGARVVAPEIADYEVRRELLRLGATAGVRRLDALKARLVYLPITTSAMLAAAEFWALMRQTGLPTAGPGELDADAILGRPGGHRRGAGRYRHDRHDERPPPRPLPGDRRAAVGDDHLRAGLRTGGVRAR
jgi:predicted nucleic acid-binding protein